MAYHLVGDSTVAQSPKEEFPLTGWGPYLTDQVSEAVHNHAKSGATTASFLEEGLWDAALKTVLPGDKVIIQFGHNDQKRRRPDLGSRDGFSTRLVSMVEDVRDSHAIPILCTSVERRTFENGVFVPSHGDYPNAVRDIANRMAVPLIDLTAFTTWLIESLGPDSSGDLFCHFAAGEHPHWPEGYDDDTHLHAEGAQKIAAFVGRMLDAIERRGGENEPLGSDTRH